MISANHFETAPYCLRFLHSERTGKRTHRKKSVIPRPLAAVGISPSGLPATIDRRDCDVGPSDLLAMTDLAGWCHRMTDS